jgi:imidazolonepropionase-like amidohydrolase
VTVNRVLVRGGRVFDGSGSAPADADVVMEGDRILEIGLGLDGDEAVDGSGMTLLPGFFDCHVHVCTSSLDLMRYIQRPFSYQFYEAARNLSATLDCGITTVRDASGADLGIKQAVADGLIEGPRMQISVTALSQTGGHGDGWMPSGVTVHHAEPHPGRPAGIVDGPEEIRRKVRELVRAGADVIKVFTSGGVLSPNDDPRHGHFRDDELAVLVAEANAAGLGVMAHAQATDGIKAALRAGIRSIEHGIYLDEEAIAMMIERGTWLVPTLVAPKAVIDAANAGAAIPESSVRKARDVMEAHRASFAMAVDAGVKIAMGTDSGVGPHGSNLDELDLMAAGGMAPAAILAATTSSAAALLGLDHDLGTLRPGARADLVMVQGDALSLAGLKGRVAGVWKDGRRVRG